MIYVGVPSHEGAAFGRGYWRTPAEMAYIYKVSKKQDVKTNLLSILSLIHWHMESD